MARDLRQIDGRLFGAIAIADRSGFPCVAARCRFKANLTGDTPRELTAARIERDEHIRLMRESGDPLHSEWRPDRDDIRAALDATFTGRRPRRAVVV